MVNFAYLRVSTSDQSTGQQISQIRAAGYAVDDDRVYVETNVSGSVPALKREQFSKLDERLGKGATLIVTNLDRMGRTVLDVVSTIDTLVNRGVKVAVLGLGVLDNSPTTRLTMTLLSAISEFERSLISQRTKAKLTQLKLEGKRLGRPEKISDEALKAKATELFAEGKSWRKVAKELNVALSTLQKMMPAKTVQQTA
ncbi:MAG: recombinase family protein [Gallionella sp.]